MELGDAHDGAYDVVEQAPGLVRLARDVHLRDGAVVRVEKRFSLDGDRRAPRVGLEVSVENRSDGPVRLDLGVEWATMLLGGGGNPAAYYEIGGARQAHDAIATSFDPPATAWWTPIETVSNSEYGFERIYQGSALVGIWPLDLQPGERRTASVTHVVSTDRDRTLESAGA